MGLAVFWEVSFIRKVNQKSGAKVLSFFGLMIITFTRKFKNFTPDHQYFKRIPVNNIMKFLKNDELGRPGLNEFRNQEKMPVTIVLDNVRSGLNVGSIFRTADSFNAGHIMLCGITSQPPERDILKSALGATESVSWKYYDTTESALRELKESGYKIYAVEQGNPSISLEVFNAFADEKYALVFGNEVKGVSESLIPLLDGCIEIPQSGIKHSLNISVCAGVVLWKFYEHLMLGKA